MTLDIRNLSPFSRFVLIDADSQTSQLLGKNNTFLNSTCISKNPLTICIKLWNNLLCIFWHATSVAKFALRRNTDVKHFYWHADLKGFSTSWVLLSPCLSSCCWMAIISQSSQTVFATFSSKKERRKTCIWIISQVLFCFGCGCGYLLFFDFSSTKDVYI